MKVEDLKVGQDLALEIEWGEARYEIPTKVIGIQDKGILIQPFVYKGTIIDLNAGYFRDMIFNIYGIDRSNLVRKVWRNVSLQITSYKGKTYYIAKINGFNAIAKPSERREHPRMPLEATGYVKEYGREETVVVAMRDVSNNGVGFSVEEKNALSGKYLKLKFEDDVRENHFTLVLKGNIVRQTNKQGRIYYGCAITEMSRDMFTYICLKRMEQAGKEKA